MHYATELSNIHRVSVIKPFHAVGWIKTIRWQDFHHILFLVLSFLTFWNLNHVTYMHTISDIHMNLNISFVPKNVISLLYLACNIVLSGAQSSTTQMKSKMSEFLHHTYRCSSESTEFEGELFLYFQTEQSSQLEAHK